MTDTRRRQHQTARLGPAVNGATPTTVTIAGRELLSFSGCNTLGMAHDPRVLEAAIHAASRYGLTSHASRSTTGNTDVHDALEARWRGIVAAEAVLLATDGYAANLAAVCAIKPDIDAVLIDEHAHASLHDAARFAGFDAITYRHADANEARQRIVGLATQRVAILTDGVFAARGNLAPIADLLAALPAEGVLLIDDCHGTANLGPRGAGTAASLGIADARIITTTTFAKAVGAGGGAIAGSERLINRIANESRISIGSTPISPALAAAADASLELLSRNDPGDRLRVSMLRNAGHVRRSLRALGIDVPDAPTPIVSFVPPSLDAVRRTFDDAGIFAPASRYPGGPASEYIRLAISARHTTEDLDRLDAALDAAMNPATRATPQELP